MRKPVFILVVATLSAAGCKSEPKLVPAHALAWLHQEDGQALRFRNSATGDTARLHTQRTTETRHVSTSKGNFVEYDAQFITLTCQGPQLKGDVGQPKVQFAFHSEGFDVYPPEAISDGLGYAAYVETASQPHDEHFTNAGAEQVEFLDNAQLAGRHYQRLLHIKLKAISLPSTVPVNTLCELWYSKDDGLVELVTINGQRWQRRW